jgi:hypothetical protein
MSSRTLQLAGLSGSALGNVFLFALIAAVPAGWCGYSQCRGGALWPAHPQSDPDLPVWITLWAPSVEDAGKGDASSCPAPAAPSGAMRVQEYSLPTGYDPAAPAGREVFACVRVGGGGEVLEAQLPAGTGRRATDGKLRASLRNGGWRFSKPPAGEPAWVRVRLSEPPPPSAPFPAPAMGELLVY